MTQEEKAKRYDEVFNAAKEWYNNPNSSSIGKSYLYAVFSELKESEDENIRKRIIHALHGDVLDMEETNKAIAWLEKQGENHDDKYNITGIKSKHAEGKLGEMIKEIKSTDKDESKIKIKYAGSEYNVLEVKDIAGVTFYGIEDEPNHIDYIKAENCERVEDEIEIPYGSKDSELQEDTYYIPKGFYAEIDDDKVVIKKGEKPTEWSEEDKVILGEIIYFFEKGIPKVQHDFRIYASWLKSLRRPMKCWMPTWEQLDALEYHLKHTNENSRLYKETKKLYDQLKKL